MTETCLNLNDSPIKKIDPDHIGVIASILCAIHCLLTPLLIVFAPSFSRIWAHPASHWIVAIVVVPIAAFMLIKGYRVHHRKWIIACGILGISLILFGAVIPYSDLTTQGGQIELPQSWETMLVNTDHTTSTAQTSECADTCCPSVVSDTESSKVGLYIPLASIVTTLGGIALIATHLGNICYFRRCKTCATNA